MNIGTTVKLPASIEKEVKESIEAMNANKLAMDHHAQRNYEISVKLWALIKSKVPDIDFTRYKYSIDHNSLEVSCIGKLQEGQP